MSTAKPPHKEKAAGDSNSDGTRETVLNIAPSGLNATQVEAAFIEAMAAAGIVPCDPSKIVADGHFTRFRVEGDKSGNKSGWSVLHADGLPAGMFGCWKDGGAARTWTARGLIEFTPAERRQHAERLRAMKAQRQAEEAARRESARREAAILWAGATRPDPAHAYFNRKGVSPHGLRQVGDRLLVPLRDGDGVLQSLQLVDPDGMKRFLPGGQTKGCFHTIDGDAATAFVAEGFATGASVAAATGAIVFCAMNCGNMLAVAKIARAKHAGARLVIAADNDRATATNPGLTHARRAAAEVGSGLVWPRFADDEDGTDFNDLQTLHGVEAVAAELENIEAPPPSASPGTPDSRRETSAENGTQGGRPKLNYAALCDLFTAARGTDSEGRKTLGFHIGAWYEHDGTAYRPRLQSDIEADLMAFLRDCDGTDHARRNTMVNVLQNLKAADVCGLPSWLPIPFWRSSREPAKGWLAMKNGLVNVEALATRFAGEVVADADITRPPSPDLFSTFGLDYDFAPSATCPRFLAYLDDVQPEPGDRDVMQMLAGLSLVPETKYNVFFILAGEGGTGKSVFLHVLRHLVGPSNVCALPLANFSDKFSSWQLTTALLNIVGDLPAHDGEGSLRHVEGMLKDASDGGLIPVEHKHQEPGLAPAIARCIFATNAMPHFSDRTLALWDRLRVIPFEQRFRGTDAENKNLRHELTDELPGVFNWAVEGLARLRTAKAFPEHSTGLEAKENHRRECDPERVFLEENFVKSGAESYIETTAAYEDFRRWTSENGYRVRNVATFEAAVKRVFKIGKERRRIDGTQRTIFPCLTRGSVHAVHALQHDI